MSTEEKSDLKWEVAHVLLVDVVGYSKLLVNDQIECLEALNGIVRAAAQFRAAEAEGKLIRLPTGDGMALLFLDSAETPVRCALEISQAATAHPKLQLRMGAHSGPIKEVKDVNDRSNVAGAGINIAQRVLDCGDAGHILLSERIADDLRSYKHWYSHLQDLGVCEVKHGLKLHLFNLCKDGLGNCAVPEKIRQQHSWQQRSRSALYRSVASSPKRKVIAAALLLSVAALAAALFVRFRGETVPVEPPLSVPEKSIAILPFGNLSDEKGNAYFADGMQDEIITDLARLADLKVISQASVMPHKAGGQRNVREIARALGVAYLLEGNVQRVGNRVRVHAQLIDARTDRHLWANRYDRELVDVFAIQSEIAEDIVGQLQTKLSPIEKAAIEDRPTSNLAAYELYIRGKSLIEAAVFSARGKEDLLAATQLLARATDADAHFAFAFYQLAHAHDQLYLRFEHTPARLALADAAIKSLRRLQPDSGEAHLALAKHLYWGYAECERAREELAIAQRKLPNDPFPPLLTAYVDRRQGRWEESISHFRRALELDPQNSFILQQLSINFQQLRRFPESAALLDRAVRLSAGDPAVLVQRATLDLDWRADTKPLRRLVDAQAHDPVKAAIIADQALFLAMCERNAKGVARAMELLGPDGCRAQGVPFPQSWCEGVAARFAGDEAGANAAFARAVTEAEKLVQEEPDDGGAVCALGMAEAALNRGAEAIAHGQRAVALLPTTKHAIDGAILLEHLAIIQGWAGDKESAIKQLLDLTQRPSSVSYGHLRLHPDWDPLRSDPRFDQIVASLAPK